MTNLYFIRLTIHAGNQNFLAWWHPDLNCFTLKEAKGVVSQATFHAQLAAAQNHARDLFSKGQLQFYSVTAHKISHESLEFSPAEISDRWTAVIPTVDRPRV